VNLKVGAQVYLGVAVLVGAGVGVIGKWRPGWLPLTYQTPTLRLTPYIFSGNRYRIASGQF